MNIKYAVFLMDCDDQQTFVDFSLAETRAIAVQKQIDSHADYCYGEAYSIAELRQLADDLDACDRF